MKESIDLTGKIAVVTGGAGIICSIMAKALAAQGAKTVILDLNKEAAYKVAAEIEMEFKTPSIGVSASVLDKSSLEAVLKEIHSKFGTIDILVNGAGGNSPAATTKVERMEGTDNENPADTFFGLQTEGFDRVFDPRRIHPETTSRPAGTNMLKATTVAKICRRLMYP